MIAAVRRWFGLPVAPDAAAPPSLIDDGTHDPLGNARSPQWPAFRRAFLAKYPACAVCGIHAGVVPHHCVPVHVSRSKELLEENLLTLCRPHHLLFGHLGDFRAWNAKVRDDAAAWNAKIRDRAYTIK